TSFAWGLCLVSLIFVLRFRFPVLGAFASPVIFLIIGYAAMQSKDVHELMPALRSNWLGFHVSTAIIAYGSFGVSFVLSLIFLLRDKMKAQGFLDQHIPQKEKLDIISYRSVSLGLLFLTFTIITGAIWAERAWGSYWSWDPKETWSLITWIIYAVYLHLRLRRGWQGKSAAVFAAVGFICVLFTYIGVNTFLPGIHSYA
ncbi:MAG: c-type cytochrome biogenesis protein CcsB, partial [Oscillospiraceae bacterium]|nr:c-type cytochrome biogenesis protein CcsB [Oscillospiraceae bacterium]